MPASTREHKTHANSIHRWEGSKFACKKFFWQHNCISKNVSAKEVAARQEVPQVFGFSWKKPVCAVGVDKIAPHRAKISPASSVVGSTTLVSSARRRKREGADKNCLLKRHVCVFPKYWLLRKFHQKKELWLMGF